ncbi:MAG: YeiH family protein [Anaerotardibacter sp.]
MNGIKSKIPGITLCVALAIPCWFLGQQFPLIGGPVFAILLGILIGCFWKNKRSFSDGIGFTSKKVLQYAVILLGFGLNLNEIAKVGAQSLPIILSTIATALIVAFIVGKLLSIPSKTSTLVGVGSSICGGSAIAATAPVIKANAEEIAQAIAVIFLFNVVAALIFPTLGTWLGLSNEGFALFAGTAINDTSSVTAAALAWDEMHPGANTLDQATIVKLTRTLAIIPITLVLGIWMAYRARQDKQAELCEGENTATENAEQSAAQTKGIKAFLGDFSLKRAFPLFILYFLGAALITTLCTSAGYDLEIFGMLKTLSKFFIIMAMLAIGLGTDLVKLVTSGGKPLLLGGICWICIAATSLGMQALLGIW